MKMDTRTALQKLELLRDKLNKPLLENLDYFINAVDTGAGLSEAQERYVFELLDFAENRK